MPVIANGDVVDESSAERILEYTGCDGIMIGRAAMGNPFLFKRISHYLETGELLEYKQCSQRVADIREYFSLLEEHELMHTVHVKAQAQWFTRGMKNGRHVRKNIDVAKNIDEILLSLDRMCKDAN
ncbi:tRNA-dihydrouridine synthase [Methanolobus sp. ZRKC4]